jgi:hypothetical protein
MKSKIKEVYLANLKERYPDVYTPGSRALALAHKAADNALAGIVKLEGKCWHGALQEVTGRVKWTKKALSELPE